MVAFGSLVFPCTGDFAKCVLASNFLPSSDEVEVTDLRTETSVGSGHSSVTCSPVKADQDDMTQYPSTHRGLSVGVGF